MEVSKKTKLEIKIIFLLSFLIVLYYAFNLFYTGSTAKYYIYPLNSQNYTSIWYYVFFIFIHLAILLKFFALQLAQKWNCNTENNQWVMVGIVLVIVSLFYYLLFGRFSLKEIMVWLDFTGWTDKKNGISGFYHPLQEIPKERRLVWFLAFLAFKIIDVLTIILVYLACIKQRLKAASIVALAFLLLSTANLIDFWLTNDQFNSIPLKLPLTIAIATAGIIFYLNEKENPEKVNSENGS